MCIVIFDLTDATALHELAAFYGVPPCAEHIENEFPRCVIKSHFGTKYACVPISAGQLVLSHPELVFCNEPRDGCFKVFVVGDECLAVHLPIQEEAGEESSPSASISEAGADESIPQPPPYAIQDSAGKTDSNVEPSEGNNE